MAESDTGPISKFPADDLRPTKRFITSHNKSGQGVFVGDDNGDHHRVMVRGKGVANIIYSTSSTPVDMNAEADITYARNNEVRFPQLCIFYLSKPPQRFVTVLTRSSTPKARYPRPKRLSSTPDRLRAGSGVAAPPRHVTGLRRRDRRCLRAHARQRRKAHHAPGGREREPRDGAQMAQCECGQELARAVCAAGL